MIVDFHGRCEVVTSKYVDGGRLAIMLVDASTKQPVAVATINMPEVPLRRDEVIIKNYGENNGLLDVLIAAGIVKNIVQHVPAGWVEAPIVRVDLDKIAMCRSLI